MGKIIKKAQVFSLEVFYALIILVMMLMIANNIENQKELYSTKKQFLLDAAIDYSHSLAKSEEFSDGLKTNNYTKIIESVKKLDVDCVQLEIYNNSFIPSNLIFSYTKNCTKSPYKDYTFWGFAVDTKKENQQDRFYILRIGFYEGR